MSTVGLHVASLTLGVPEFLVRDFVSYAFNGRKLQTADSTVDDYAFEMAELQSYTVVSWKNATPTELL